MGHFERMGCALSSVAERVVDIDEVVGPIPTGRTCKRENTIRNNRAHS